MGDQVTASPARPAKKRKSGSTRREAGSRLGGYQRNAGTAPMDTQHPGRDSRNETTPWHIWKHAVFEIAGVTVEEGERYATRERIHRAYQAGEPAWMAADMVRQFVDGARRALRDVNRPEILRSVMVAGTAHAERDRHRATEKEDMKKSKEELERDIAAYLAQSSPARRSTHEATNDAGAQVFRPRFKPCTQEDFNDKLEVLPPIGWTRMGFLVGEPWSHRACHVTGRYSPTYQAMVERNGEYLQSSEGITLAEWRALHPVTLQVMASKVEP